MTHSERGAVDGLVAVRTTTFDGPGIPELQQQLRIQQREIDQLHHSTGMGIRLVSIIVTQSGGTLSVETEPAGGSTVTMTFPDRRSQQPVS